MQQSEDKDLNSRSSNLAPGSNPDTINLLDFFEVIVKRRRMIFVTTLAMALISVTISLSMPRIYSATARILPPQQDSGMMGMLSQMGGGMMANLAGDLLGKGGPADLYAKILESEAVKDAIIDRFNVIVEEKTNSRIAAYDKLNQRVQIETGKKDGIISITVDDKDPKRAADMANAYVEELGRFVVRLNLTGISSNRVYLEERLAKVKADFDNAAEALKAFQTRYRTLDLPEQAKGTIKGVAELEGQLAAEEVKLAGLRRVFTDTSQEVKNQRTVISNIRGQIAKFEGNRQGGSLPGIGSVPAMGQDYLRLMRELRMQETLFELLTKQNELAKLSEAKDISTVQVIQKARVPDKSLKPSRRKFVTMVTAATFVVTVFLAFVLEISEQIDAGQKQRLQGLCRRLVSLRRDA